MASSGKKGKKPKGKTIALTEFLADGSTGAPPPVILRKAWGDEVENEDDSFESMGRNKQPVILPTAPRATRSPNVDDENIPRVPPFMAYISNLQYDVKEDEIQDFFNDMKIVTVRLPRDDRSGGRLKGFGYVEFESRESLIAALNIPDTTINGRRIRIEIASNSENERRGMSRGGMRDMGYDRSDGPDRTMGDWRSGPRDERPPDNRDGDSSRGSFTRDNMNGPSTSDRGSFTRDNMNGRDHDRGAFTRENMNGPDRQSFGRDNDRGFNRDSDRGAFTRENMNGPDRQSFNRDNDRGFGRDGDRGYNDRGYNRDGDRGYNRDNDRGFNRDGDRGFGRDNDRGSFNRDGNQDRGAFTRENMNGPPSQQERGGYGRDSVDGNRKEGGFDRGYRSNYSERGDADRFSGRREFKEAPRLRDEAEPQTMEAPKERPKLNLAPRTLPTEATPAPEQVQAAIFGGARPVDTAAREREIEDRLAKKKEKPARPDASESVKSGGSSSGDDTKPSVDAVTASNVPAAESAWHRRPQLDTAAPAHPASGTRSTPRHHYTPPGDGIRANPRGGPRTSRAPPPSPPKKAEPKPEKDPNEVPRMPKLREQAAPNFIASNKYGNLPIEDEDLAVE